MTFRSSSVSDKLPKDFTTQKSFEEEATSNKTSGFWYYYSTAFS